MHGVRSHADRGLAEAPLRQHGHRCLPVHLPRPARDQPQLPDWDVLHILDAIDVAARRSIAGGPRPCGPGLRDQ